jgi:murein DD-endopeptidase MepM/ murein hydrolase activator NlpD
VVAVADGTVTFAGFVGGRLYVTLDHGGGLESTYSFLGSRLVSRNDVVTAGAPIATSGTGHTGSEVPHLHLGAKLSDVYVDPLDYLVPLSVTSFIRLAPL